MRSLVPFPLTEDDLRALVREMALDSALVDRFAWWLQHGFSSEHWVQFELAYRLQKQLGGRYAVGCERKFIDIVLYPRSAVTSAFSEARFTAAIELKWYGNWWLRDHGKLFKDDVAKIDGYDVPAVSLCAWLHAWPADSSLPHRWIRRAVNDGTGVRTADELRRVLAASAGREPEIDLFCACAPHPAFDELSFGVLGCSNRRSPTQAA